MYFAMLSNFSTYKNMGLFLSAYDTWYEKIAINNSVIDGKLRIQIR